VDGERVVRAIFFAALLLGAACSSTELYRWGPYEDSIATMYATGSGYDPAREVARLVEWIEETQNRGKLVPPGARAHVGFLLVEAGNTERGVAFLTAEKTAYPESATFIDGLFARVGKQAPPPSADAPKEAR
jgi:hypothetical protein